MVRCRTWQVTNPAGPFIAAETSYTLLPSWLPASPCPAAESSERDRERRRKKKRKEIEIVRRVRKRRIASDLSVGLPPLSPTTPPPPPLRVLAERSQHHRRHTYPGGPLTEQTPPALCFPADPWGAYVRLQDDLHSCYPRSPLFFFLLNCSTSTCIHTAPLGSTGRCEPRALRI